MEQEVLQITVTRLMPYEDLVTHKVEVKDMETREYVTMQLSANDPIFLGVSRGIKCLREQQADQKAKEDGFFEGFFNRWRNF